MLLASTTTVSPKQVCLCPPKEGQGNVLRKVSKKVSYVCLGAIFQLSHMVLHYQLICTTFSMPTSMTTSSNIRHNVSTFFTLLKASTDFKKITSPFEATKKLLMVWFFPSVHPYERIVQPYIFHSFFCSSTIGLSLSIAFMSNLQIQILILIHKKIA